MYSTDSLSDKIARSPFRFGMIVGFLGVPIVWMSGDSLVRVALGQGVLPVETFWSYEASGALFGAFLGGQCASMWARWRVGKMGEARSIAFFSGVLGVAFYILGAWVLAHPAFQSPVYGFVGASDLWGDFRWRLVQLIVNRHLPFLLSLLLAFVGLFAPKS